MQMTLRRSGLMAGALALMFSLASCGGPAQAPRAQKGAMDTPEYHQERGDKYLMNHQYHEAKKAYNLALELEASDSKSLSGKAVALGYLAQGDSVSPATQTQVFGEGKGLLERALDSAKGKKDQARAHTYAVRFSVVMELPKGEWYEQAKDHFDDAISLTPNDPEPYFFMAAAEAARLNYAQATEHYKKVLSIGRAYDVEADQELKRIQKVQRALPGSRFGQQVGNQRTISRADMAALLLAELRLDRLYVSQAKALSPSFAPPASQRRMQTSAAQRMPDATDLTGHPMKDSVELILSMGIKGLEADAGHKYYPSADLTRGEFAMVIQDLLVKITKDNSLETKFVGQESPYSDVPDYHFTYNAVRTVVSHGLMQPENSGRFNRMGKVSGADALLAIRNLKSMLKNY